VTGILLKGEPEGQEESDDDGNHDEGGILYGVFLFTFRKVVIRRGIEFVHGWNLGTQMYTRNGFVVLFLTDYCLLLINYYGQILMIIITTIAVLRMKSPTVVRVKRELLSSSKCSVSVCMVLEIDNTKIYPDFRQHNVQ
jgi:hypothetical protein